MKRLVVMGTRDGMGITSLSVAISQQLSKRAPVLLWDCDSRHGGGMARKMRCTDKIHRLSDVSSNREKLTGGRLQKYLTLRDNILGIEVDWEESRDAITVSADFIRDVAEYHIVDGGSRWSANLIYFLEGAHVLLLTSPLLEEMRATSSVIHELSVAGVLSQSISLAVYRNYESGGCLDEKSILREYASHHCVWLDNGNASDSENRLLESFVFGWSEGHYARLESLDGMQLLTDGLQCRTFHTENDEEILSSGEKMEHDLVREISGKIHAAMDWVALSSKKNEEIACEIENQSITYMQKRGCVSSALWKKVAQDTVNYIMGFGPLEGLLKDDHISEIMVNRHDCILIEKNGKIEQTALSFSNELHLSRIIDRILAPIGRRVDEQSPMVDARLADGSRVNIIIPPLAIDGAVMTIRRFRSDMVSMDDLIKNHSLDGEMADFLGMAVQSRQNMIVSGGTGSGKTTVLNVLSSLISESERIITIEDSAELSFKKSHLIRLEARPPSVEGSGEIAIRDLLRNSLRMRPDRIIIGECRGAEALDMLQAMNTGHSGSLSTIHANSPRDVVSRLSTLVMFSDAQLPERAIREQIASAIQIIIHLERDMSGGRRISRISEITGLEGVTITLNDLFFWDGKEFQSTGFRARFQEKPSIQRGAADVA